MVFLRQYISSHCDGYQGKYPRMTAVRRGPSSAPPGAISRPLAAPSPDLQFRASCEEGPLWTQADHRRVVQGTPQDRSVRALRLSCVPRLWGPREWRVCLPVGERLQWPWPGRGDHRPRDERRISLPGEGGGDEALEAGAGAACGAQDAPPRATAGCVRPFDRTASPQPGKHEPHRGKEPPAGDLWPEEDRETGDRTTQVRGILTKHILTPALRATSLPMTL